MGYVSEIRKYVGHRPIVLTSTICIIYDKEKGILFEKRSDNGMWCVPGGIVELDESLSQALKREVKEETSLYISKPRLFDVKANVHAIYPNKDEVFYTEVVYVVNEYYGDINNDEESTEIRWFKINELPQKIVPSQIEFIEKFVKEIYR